MKNQLQNLNININHLLIAGGVIVGSVIIGVLANGGGYQSETSKLEIEYSKMVNEQEIERKEMERKHGLETCELEKKIASSNLFDEANGISTGKDLEVLKLKKVADCNALFGESPLEEPSS